MSEMTIFGGSNLPAHLQGKAEGFNAKAGGGVQVSTSMRALRHGGKIWSVKINKDDENIFKGPDGRNAQDLYVAIVEVRGVVSNRFYTGEYGADDAELKCFSVDGKTADALVKIPEHSNCMQCPHNEFGSRGGGKACADYRRVVLVPVDAQIDPDGSVSNVTLQDSQLRWDIPAASLRNYDGYWQVLDDNNAPMNGVVTRLSFDDDSRFPKIKFSAAGWLNEDQFAAVEAMADDADVKKIIDGAQERSGYKFAHDEEDDAPTQSKPDVTDKKKKTEPVEEKESDSGDASQGPSDDALKNLGVEGF
jgi:hypothetical protein